MTVPIMIALDTPTNTPPVVQQIELVAPAILEQQWAVLWENVPVPAHLNAALQGTRVYKMQRNPLLWVVDFENLAIQSATLNRIAALIERNNAPKDRIVTPAELARFTATANKSTMQNKNRLFLGHDYRLESVAQFFSLAQQHQVPLNAAEQAFLALMHKLGLLTFTATGTWQAAQPGTAVVTIAGASKTPSLEHLSPAERLAVLRHELSHGEYFTNSRYREYCQRFWAERNPAEQSTIINGLNLLGYNTTDQELVVNELQAFLWEPEAGAWIDLGLRKLGSSLTTLRNIFVTGLGTTADPISDLLTMDIMRRIPVRLTGDWGAAMRDWSIAKIIE